MDPLILGLVGFACTLLLLIVRVPIAFSLAGVSTTFIFLFFAMRHGGFDIDSAIAPTLSMVSSNAFDLVHSYDLSMIPLFVLLGHIAYHTGITTDIYHAARVCLKRLPGGVAMASVFGCGGFSAITGSSIACASAMGKICVPEMLRMGYDKRLATSTVAVGGTLGSLIPPSVLFIVYGIFTEMSVSRLFLAGVIPGLISLAGFLVVIYLWVKRNPEDAPVDNTILAKGERRKAAISCWPALLLFTIIIGGIYGGFFTATEAAAISAFSVIIIGSLQKRLNWSQFILSIKETCTQTTAIFFIAAGAKIFVGFVALTGMAPALVGLIEAADVSLWLLLIMIAAVYFLLGMFLDPLGIMVLTLPFLIPMVEGYGLDLIWFGVVVIKLLEISLITPPVGLNVFVIASVTKPSVAVYDIFVGVTRFLIMDVLVLAAIIAFPILSLLLPNLMM
ncbi:TRAP transporter large permease [Colwellia hornerae]|uniref:TRAP transporter large permease protein n=1 Tax=Colwellia hornerae TaxID=89402 RepID=A0A5C6QND1_9GAMM|nr:TRAP transporter large permease [Colwellia hornerae]TWX53714.1 TRAP transporter large permease [Colwellia hornerae]TWX60364.1 TRAP transporter large permease [Colwellia hornerae]TWX70120.1 TRAP transporter large permease [Colwellia hornerae]